MNALVPSSDRQEGKVPPPTALWDAAMLVAGALAVEPHRLGGALIRAGAGPVREAWIAAHRSLMAPSAPSRRMPASIDDDRLLGGLDLAGTLAGGHVVAQRGLLAECDGGVLLVPMAERMPPGTAAHLAASLDRGVTVTERDGLTLLSPARLCVLALDESEADDPQVPPALQDRLAFRLDLNALSHRDLAPLPFNHADIATARALLPAVGLDDEGLTALAGLGDALGVPSLRCFAHAALTARVLAALNGLTRVGTNEISIAAALVYAPRATRLPASEPAEEDAPPPPPAGQPDAPADPSASQPDDRPLDDVVLDATMAAIPAGLLASLLAGQPTGRSRHAGKAGARQKQASRGRKIGSRPARMGASARIDLIATLKAAAPWQRLRRSNEGPPGPLVRVTRDDLRVARHRHRTGTTTIFVVDASGSSALQRLAEAKGAVRLLLGECYIRRDEVALIAFRGQGADLLLAPTRALTHAQRALAALPGGGGTPVAAGLDAAHRLAAQVAREGRTPLLVVMTDGKANVARDGAHGRPKAQEDARAAARRLAAAGHSSLLIDISPQPQPLAAELAAAMQGRYLALPRADARRVAAAISAAAALERGAA